MRAGIVPAILIGAGAGLHLCAAWRILEAVFWPRAGGALFLLTLLGASAGAAAAFLAGGPGEDGKGRRRQGWIYLFWGAAALGTLAALSTAAGGSGAGAQGGRPAYLAFLLALPPAFAFAAPFRGGSSSGGGAPAYFLTGMGAALGLSLSVSSDPVTLGLAGVFIGTIPALAAGGRDALLRRAAAVVLMAAALSVMAAGFRARSPAAGETASWGASGRIEPVEPGEGWGVMDVNGGMREVVYKAPSARALAFPIRPGADGRIDVLSLGFPRADVLRWLLGKGASVTVYEPDSLLAEEIRRLRPDLTEGGSVRFQGGDLRTFLSGREGDLDLLILAAVPAPAAYLSGATAFQEDYTTTVEAFRSYIRSLAPRGLIFSERPGNGRVVTTLREAAPPGNVAFSQQIVVMGRKGRLVTQCWYSPAGFGKRDLERMNGYAVREGLEIFISPQTRLKWSLYYNLVHGELVKGYYFTTPRDLSPSRDDRPFFGHFERLMISPSGKALPEERGLWQEEWGLRFIPPGDRALWLVPAAGLLLLPLMILLPAAVFAHRTGLARHGMRYPWLFLLLGLSLAAALRALAGYGRLLGSVEGGGMPATAIFLAVAGAGWILPSGREGLWKGTGIPLAILFAAMGVGGYAFDGPRGTAGALLVILLASLAGLGAGRLSSSLLHSADDVLEGTLPWYASFLILGAVTGWALSTLGAVFFGFPVLWIVSAAGLLVVARAGRKL